VLNRGVAMTIANKVKIRIKRSKRYVFARADGVILEAIEKLGVDYKFDDFSQQSINGGSLQAPASFQIITNSRFKRKIVVINRSINAG